MDRDRKGQISIIIVLVVVLVLLVVVMLVTTQGGIEEDIVKELDIQPLQLQVESCISDVVEEALGVWGLHGGYIETQEPSYFYSFFNISYLYYLGGYHYPSRGDVEGQVDRYVETQEERCRDELEVFSEIVSVGEMEAVTSIGDEETSVIVDWPISVQSGSRVATLESFSSTVPFNYGTVDRVVGNILGRLDPGSELFDIIFLVDQNITIDVTVEDHTSVYMLSDDELVLGQEKFLFIFATRFS